MGSFKHHHLHLLNREDFTGASNHLSYFLRTYYVSGTVPGVQGTRVNTKNPCLCGAYNPVEGTKENKQYVMHQMEIRK